ncbi:alpha/beta fold hydrolase [Rheinheimera baltica]|uniref:alpha/beta fold hydrolase n=1 Tax=Rheinheimera baltica TaxID=67576 RepID=UPI00273DB8CE|nr:alpha/beta fold hydrolase [Rheinheimera baltica]MDP5142184.1 alpha/beta fold hydrolase [Rheinheimera baltica]
MMNCKTQLFDDVTLTYAISRISTQKPWLTLILPFGFKVDTAMEFFSHFADRYNLLTWQARLILAPHQVEVLPEQLTVAKHAEDLYTLMDALKIQQTDLVGYCSGAGIAIAAANMQSDRIGRLALVNGEFALLTDRNAVTQYGGDIDGVLPMAARDPATAEFILQRISTVERDAVDGVHCNIMLPFSDPCYFHRYAMNYVNYRAAQFDQLACSVMNKTLLLAGEQDQQTNVYSARLMQQLIPDASLVSEPEGDHYGILRRYSSTLTNLRSFFIEEPEYAC